MDICAYKTDSQVYSNSKRQLLVLGSKAKYKYLAISAGLEEAQSLNRALIELRVTYLLQYTIRKDNLLS